MTVALLVAAKSEPFDEEILAARAEALLARPYIEIVADAGHALAVSHVDVCTASIARMAAR